MSYLGSGTTRCRVVFYLGGSEPGLRRPEDEIIEFSATPGASYEAETIVSASTNKSLGAAAETFSLRIKTRRNLLLELNDDDWVDIAFTRGPSEWHVCRGLITQIIERKTAASGATDVTYDILGEGFGKIFTRTPIWFNRFAGEEISWLGARIWELYSATYANPAKTIQAILRGFTGQLIGSEYDTQQALNDDLAAWIAEGNVGPSPDYGKVQQAHQWILPDAMRSGLIGLARDQTQVDRVAFADAFAIYTRDLFTDARPSRLSTLAPMYAWPTNQDLWSFALQWSDPALSELWCDLMVLDPLSGQEERGSLRYPDVVGGYGTPTPIGSLEMGVIFRDRPFPDSVSFSPTETSSIPFEFLPDHPWFQDRYPTYVVPPETIRASTLSRSGNDRRNTFFLSAKLQEALVAGHLEFQTPEWNRDSILNHGIRRMDVTTNYIGDPESSSDQLFLVGTDYRERLRDIHSLNHLYLSGTLALNQGRPDIRIGSKLRSGDRTFYVEAISHNWDLSNGVKTSIGVSRGWEGSDEELRQTLVEEGKAYTYNTSTAGSFRGRKTAGRRRPLKPRKTGTYTTSGLYEISTRGNVAQDTTGAHEITAGEWPVLVNKAMAWINASVASEVTAGYAKAQSNLTTRLAAYASYNSSYDPDIPATATSEQMAHQLMDSTWADRTSFQGRRLWEICKAECSFFVGRPNYLYEEKAANFAGWQKIWAGIKAGSMVGSDWVPAPEGRSYIRQTTVTDPATGEERIKKEGPSSATGLGQLLATAAVGYYPSGVNGIGNDFEEMVGYIRYILDRYGDPWSAHIFKFGDFNYPASRPDLRDRHGWY